VPGREGKADPLALPEPRGEVQRVERRADLHVVVEVHVDVAARGAPSLDAGGPRVQRRAVVAAHVEALVAVQADQACVVGSTSVPGGTFENPVWLAPKVHGGSCKGR